MGTGLTRFAAMFPRAPHRGPGIAANPPGFADRNPDCVFVAPNYSISSIERGQLFLSSRESARSARILPPVWQRAQ